MKAKSKNTRRTTATIANVDPQLEALLNEFTYKSYEMRCRSHGQDSLYIRLTRVTPSVHFKIV